MNKAVIFLKSHLFEAITAFFWLLLLSSYFILRQIYGFSDETAIRKVYFFLKYEGIYGGIIYILIYVIRTVIFFPASFIVILSPSLFGLPLAILYTVIGENLSALLGYFLGKVFGKRIISEAFMDKSKFLKKSLREDAFMSILSARLLFMPFDPLNYLSGFFKIKLSGYFWGTLLGTLPGLLIFLFAGAGIKNIESFRLSELKINHSYLLISVLVVFISIGTVLYLRLHNKNKKTEAGNL